MAGLIQPFQVLVIHLDQRLGQSAIFVEPVTGQFQLTRLQGEIAEPEAGLGMLIHACRFAGIALQDHPCRFIGRCRVAAGSLQIALSQLDFRQQVARTRAAPQRVRGHFA